MMGYITMGFHYGRCVALALDSACVRRANYPRLGLFLELW